MTALLQWLPDAWRGGGVVRKRDVEVRRRRVFSIRFKPLKPQVSWTKPAVQGRRLVECIVSWRS
jgi:hypothetical protein